MALSGTRASWTRHGYTAGGVVHPAYAAWRNMKQRALNPNNPRSQDYSERGITIEDPRWYAFENFLEDMGEPPFKGATIERKDNERGYCKGNCAWETKKAQNNNRRSRYRDKTHCAKGHELSGDNLIIRPSGGKPDGGRGCRICALEATRRWRAVAVGAGTHGTE